MEHRARAIEGRVARLLAENPGVIVTGPRGCGKTTSLAPLARTRVELSDPWAREAVATDPVAALHGLAEPILVDDCHRVPGLSSIIAERFGGTPGRIILAGSARQGDLGPGGGPATTASPAPVARFPSLTMYSPSRAEIDGTSHNAVDMAFADPSEMGRAGFADLNRTDYVELAMRGSSPATLALNSTGRRQWLQTRARELVEADAFDLADLRHPAKLASVLRVAAANTGRLLRPESLCRDAGVARTTLATHLDLLEQLHAVVRLAAFDDGSGARMIRSPKLHFTDSALAAAVLGVDRESLRFDYRRTEGLLETFVFGELIRHGTDSSPSVEMMHLRSQEAHEVDFVARAPDGGLVAFDVKAVLRPTPADARGLRWLASRSGHAFVAGYLLHTGPVVEQLGERLWAVPIERLWRPALG